MKEIMTYFTPGGLFIIIILILLGTFLRVKDCLECKRNLIKSIIVSLTIISLNWLVALGIFLVFGEIGGLIKEKFYIPLYLQYAYFVICVIGGGYGFSRFFLLLHLFYLNFRDEGKLTFKGNIKDVKYRM